MSRSNIRPLGDRVAVRRSAPEDRTRGGLLRATALEQQTGLVLAVGRQCVAVEPGDWALVDKWARDEFSVDGEKTLVTHETDVLAVMRDGAVYLLQDRVLVYRDGRAEQYGAVLLPEDSRDKAKTGVVVAHGRGVSVRKGDHVLAPLYAGLDVTFRGRTFWMLRDSEIAGVLG